MKKKKEFGLFIKLTEEENKIVKEMKQKYCINMSQFVRNKIKEFYGGLRVNGEKKI